MKELRFTAAITVIDDVLDQAETIAKVKPAWLAFVESVTLAVGAENVTAETVLVTPKPRAAKNAPPLDPAKVEHLPLGLTRHTAAA